MTEALFDMITVHCFTCPHTERGITPQDAHARMETHYRTAHAALIAAIIRRLAH